MEYIKFWIARDLWEFGVVLAIFAVAVCIAFIMWVVDSIRARRRRAAEKKWNETLVADKEKGEELGI